MALQEQTLPLGGIAQDRTGNYRTDHLLGAAIVSFPNFGFWKMRLQLLVGGHMPRTENLPATWYDTANIHFCTIKDFVELCDAINVKMERAVALDLYGRPLRLNLPWWFWNMFGEQGVFLLSRAGGGK